MAVGTKQRSVVDVIVIVVTVIVMVIITIGMVIAIVIVASAVPRGRLSSDEQSVRFWIMRYRV